MEWYNLIGLIASLMSMFSGFVAILLYFKVRKLVSLLTDEQLEGAGPFIQKQYKKIKIFLLVCFVLGIAGVILMLI